MRRGTVRRQPGGPTAAGTHAGTDPVREHEAAIRAEARSTRAAARCPHPPTSPHAFASTWPSMVPPSAAVARGTPWHVVYQHETRRTAYDVTGCASRATCAPPGAAAHRGAVSTQSTARCREYSEYGTAPQSTVGDDSPLRRGSGRWRLSCEPIGSVGEEGLPVPAHAIREYALQRYSVLRHATFRSGTSAL